jgi:hypothetical protein
MLELLEDRSLLSATVPSSASAAASYGQLPLGLQANRGQAAPQFNYFAQGGGYTLGLNAQQAVLNLNTSATSATPGTTLTMQLVGANPSAQAVASDPLITRSNYLVGPDPSQWITGVPNYGQVTYQDVYRGTDLTYSGTQGQLEYTFTVHPGAKVSAIRLQFQGQQGLSVDGQGNLVLHTAGGPIEELAPVAYQVNADGSHTAVASRYVLEGGGRVGFQVGAHDASRPLVIDPTLSYSSYLSGIAYAVAVDANGDAFVTGANGFVGELNPTGTALIYSTTLGSSTGLGIAVDSAGDAYVTGLAGSNLPTTANAAYPSTTAAHSGFFTEVNPSGSGLIYSTYIPNGAESSAQMWGSPGAIALSSSGNVYLTGAAGPGLPTTAGAFQSTDNASNQGTNAYFVEINPNQSGSASWVYASYLGGSGAKDEGTGVAVDGAGNAYVVGETTSTNFPMTAGAFQAAYSTSGGVGSAIAIGDAFVAKFNPSASGAASLVYSTYLGSFDGWISYWYSVSDDSFEKPGPSVAVNSAGDAYVAGGTNSITFPITSGAYMTSPPTANSGRGATVNAFVTELNATGSGLIYSTYLGGNDQDAATGITLDSQGNAYVTGWTRSTNFPTLNPVQATKAKGNDSWGNPNSDVFVTTLNAAGSGLLFSTYLGGTLNDWGEGIAVDGSGNIYVAGRTQSTNFPTTAGAYQTTPGGGFVSKISAPVGGSLPAADGTTPPAWTAGGPLMVSPVGSTSPLGAMVQPSNTAALTDSAAAGAGTFDVTPVDGENGLPWGPAWKRRRGS